jgi:hypothetical protein
MTFTYKSAPQSRTSFFGTIVPISPRIEFLDKAAGDHIFTH